MALGAGRAELFPVTGGTGSDPGNARTGQVAHASTVLLLDDATGYPRAVVGASHLTALRTAAADAVAVDALARRHPSRRRRHRPPGLLRRPRHRAIAAHGADSDLVVWGAEPDGVADAHRSLTSGRLQTDGNTSSIADGLLAVLSQRTLSILQQHDVEIVTVTDGEIVDAMALLFTRAKQVVEPSGATALAGLLALARQRVLPDHVGVILSGGNVDLAHLPFEPER